VVAQQSIVGMWRRRVRADMCWIAVKLCDGVERLTIRL
jgi:hypothetical protein